MKKKLSEMTLEELWQLFPIILTEHQECWKDWYAEEGAFLSKFFPENTRIYHIGSTAISSIWAKPIIDILVEASDENDFSDLRKIIVNAGYICMSQNENRVSFNKGYTENGFADKVFHLHLRHSGDNDEVYFRDYLNAHPEIAKQYEQLKLGLWKQFVHDRDGYTEAKKEFVEKYTLLAKMEVEEI